MTETLQSSNGWDNCTLTARFRITDTLAIFRIRPDGPLFDFLAGQYTVIGLPSGAPRCSSSDREEPETQAPNRLLRRAYSVASSSKQREYIEVFIVLVRSGALTPRLWLLQPGDRLWMAPKAKGHFSMDMVPPDKNVVLVGTGTGLAPYISMVRDHHRCNKGRKFVVVHGARYARELGYRSELEELQSGCQTLAYLPTITRPEETRENRWRGHVGRVQSVFSDGAIETALNGPLSPESTDVFLSGNPEMVEDMERLLKPRSFTLHSGRSPGTLHVERYW